MDAGVQDFHDYLVHDAMGHIDGITSKKMFGGFGLYLDGNIFAIITSSDDVWFKVDETNQADYEAVGSKQFVYTGHKNKKPTTMPYWIVPEEILEDREKIEEWILKSAAISKATKKKD